MKNLKKVLALVVVFAMMMSTLAFAAGFPDVAADADYANAINVLSDLGFFTGDDKGNFNPDATITRAEYAVVVCRILNLNAAGVSEFADVAADHWATGYVNAASQAGIIKGYGNGNFGPSDPVKYEEAVTMLVRALGYEPLAIAKGNWPQGHINVASSYGLLTAVDGSVGEGAKRSAVAVMTYNALDIPVVEQTGFGTDVQYTIMKKGKETDKATLLTKLDIYKVGGYVCANSKTFFSPAIGEAEFATVEFAITDDFDNPIASLAFGDENANLPEKDATKTFRDTANLAGDYVAKNAVAYVQEYAKNKFEVVGFELGEAAETLVIDLADVNVAKSTFDGKTPVVKYYKEGSSRLGEIDLKEGYDIVLNGQKLDDANKKAVIDLIAKGELACDVEFINLEDDRTYNIIDIVAYTHLLVEEVDAKNGIIETYNDVRINLDLDDDEALVTIKDVNGADVDVASLKEYDVLAVVVSPSPIVEAKAFDKEVFKSLDIVTLGQSKVDGVIKGQGETASGAPVYTIGGTKYEFESSKVGLSAVEDYKNGNTEIGVNKKDVVGSEGTFFLGINGKIVGFEGTKAVDGNYAFIVGAYGTRATNATLTLLTEAGIKTFTYADNVKFMDPETGKYSRVSVKDPVKEITTLGNTKWDTLIKNNSAAYIYTALADAFNDEIVNIKAEVEKELIDGYKTTNKITDRDLTADEEKAALKDLAAAYEARKIAETELRFIQYNTNAAGEIAEILPMSTASKEIENVAKTEYKASKQAFGSKLLSDDLAIFDIDFEDLTLSTVKGISYLADESEYASVLYNRNDDGEYKAMIILDSDSAFAPGAPLAIVKDVETGKNEETDAKIATVTVLVNGEEKTIVVDEEETKDVNFADFEFGKFILYNADAEGLVNSYAVVGTAKVTDEKVDFTFNPNFDKDRADYNVDKDTYEEDDAYFFGYYVGKNTKTLDIHVDSYIAASDWNKDLPKTETSKTENAVEYLPLVGYSNADLYQFTMGRDVEVELGNGVAGLTKFDDTDDTIKNYVLVRTVDGAIQEVVGFEIDVPVKK